MKRATIERAIIKWRLAKMREEFASDADYAVFMGILEERAQEKLKTLRPCKALGAPGEPEDA